MTCTKVRPRSPSHSMRSVAGSSLANARKLRTWSSMASASARLCRAIEPPAHGKREAQRAIGARADRRQFGEAHEQCADQTNGVGVLNELSRGHGCGLLSMLQYPPGCGSPRGAGSVRRGLKVSPRLRLEKTAVALRKVPGALAVGLLASLAAHTALFGGSHAMGGAYHELFLQAALTIVVGACLLFASLAWSGAKSTADGSVLAARLCSRFPSARCRRRLQSAVVRRRRGTGTKTRRTARSR